MRKAALVTLLVALGGLSACLDAQAPPKELTLEARIRRVEDRLNLTERMQRYKVPGVSIAVINEGRVEWARGFGVKEAGGIDEGFEAYWTAYESTGQGAVVMTNGSGGYDLAVEVIRAIAHEYDWPAFIKV